MSTTADKIEGALHRAQAAGTPVMVDSLTLMHAVDEIRAARPKGKVPANAWDRGYEQGRQAERRANAAGEQALKSKVTGALEVMATWEHHGADEDRAYGTADAYARCASELRVALEVGDVTIACPCGAS